jgi:hypothetical protein
MDVFLEDGWGDVPTAHDDGRTVPQTGFASPEIRPEDS